MKLSSNTIIVFLWGFSSWDEATYPFLEEMLSGPVTLQQLLDTRSRLIQRAILNGIFSTNVVQTNIRAYYAERQAMAPVLEEARKAGFYDTFRSEIGFL